MFILYNIIVVSFLLVFFLSLLSILISEISFINREELRTYECGFEHHSLSRTPFSLRYFLLTLVFLLFDLEILFLIFLPFSYFNSLTLVFLLFLFIFLVVLLLGLLFEWYDGSLEWLN